MATSAHPARNPVSGVLLSSADVARVVDRMAHQLIEKAGDSLPELVLVGIPTRGAPLARRLAARVEAFSGSAVDVGTADITLYRDDLRRRGVRALEPTVLPDAGIDDRFVVLVDDVLFSGRSVRAALDALRDLGRPRAVQLAVPVDRGHRELPIRADFVGQNVPTSRSQQVKVRLAETDGTDEVLVTEGGPGVREPRGEEAQGSATCWRRPTWTAPTPPWCSTPRHRSRRRSPDARSRSCRRCAAARWSTSSTRTRPAPASPSSWPRSASPPTSSTSPRRAAASPRARA